jgi:hypothetical protein
VQALVAHLPVAHLPATLQQGQSPSAALMLISALVAWDCAEPAAAGKTVRLVASNAAIIRRSVRIGANICCEHSLVNSQHCAQFCRLARSATRVRAAILHDKSC